MTRNVSDFLIVEDELLIAESIVEILKNAGYRHIRVASSVEEAVHEIGLFRPDIVLTDIQLGQRQSGIDLGKLLSKDYGIPFIYITSHFSAGIVNEAMHTRPNAYIIKPFRNEDLLVAVELALFNSNNRYSNAAGDCLQVKEGHALTNLAFDNIMWLEANGGGSTINISNGKSRNIDFSLNDFETRVNRKKFIQINPSVLVNCAYISEIRKESLLVNGRELAIEEPYRARVASYFSC